MSRLLCIALLFLAVAPAQAQTPVWVFLHPDAVAGGTMVRAPGRAGLANDHAIPRAILARIAGTGARVRYTSRWLQAVSVAADAATIARIKRLPQVSRIEPVGFVYEQTSRRARAHAHSHTRPLADFDSAFYGLNWKAIKLLGVPSSHLLGFTAKGVRIAILDTGFEPAHQALSARRVAAQRDFINNDANVANQPGDPTDPALDQEVHGTQVWSILGGFAPGRVVGPAYDASFILAKVDVVQRDSADFKADEDRWVAAVEWADSMGARIINSSLGYRDFVDAPRYQKSALDGNTARSTRMADEAARRGILIVNAMGNYGPEATSLQAPADADSIIAVGAVDDAARPAVFSNGRSTSRGPTFDGRLKPELVAPGIGITGAHAQDQTSYDTGLEGTSFATPFIAGVAAMFMQAWPNLSIMAIRRALMLAGSRADFPDNNVGFGIPNVSSAILFPEGLTAVGITGVNLDNELTTIQPTFTWSNGGLVNQAMKPVRYRLEIATDPVFNNVIYTDTVSEQSSITMKRPLRPAPALWWRVTAEAFPNIRRTTRSTGPFVVPNWVRLLTFNVPTGTFTDSVRPLLRWEPLAAPSPSGPFIYDVQILSAQTGVPIQTITNVTTAAIQPPLPLTPNVAYKWRVIARSQLGIADTVESIGVFVVRSDQAPPATLLYQNFPNPFPRRDLGLTNTRVWFDVNTSAVVELAVYDLRGRMIRRLIPAQPSCQAVTLPPGQYGRSPAEPDPCVSTSWDGTDAGGNAVARGIYILRLRTGGVDEVKKILYMPD